ncbi:STAS/SEC14 domain-containing protein [Sphingobium yanoikuyae]|uniref:STAS/SEC14 domain-containing protein n=2 Tax=Sphingomonadaceae TaxID=41297 RepID=A0A6P1GMA1_SPHYA|nr:MULTISPECIES: STAS/SEC14 domain-containing protein [Sphingomonadaceae]MBP8233073.1 STAS/SEC14 domain-containing protein [Rhizorhabdus sp.]MDG2515104.1 STAS/SEC14 domain-containing protein [Sphingobium yanoikuyae]QHD69540.1 STAS/SEC14 domain-containing protein [Sphingobium yanoikuyae]RSU70666.1 STAS/SEC14 domain-containing protein [Sphingomonas sp. S-NIH.Pt3_0716]
MHRVIEAGDDVIALEVSGKITGADLDAMMDRLDQAMAHHEKIHIFVETRGIDGIELTGLPGYVARAMPLFGKLTRFGRVAVVADQTWVRIGTRVESAVLPFISYKTFEPAQREEALAWVKGAPSAA